MAAFTQKAAGDFNATGATTWNEAGSPTTGDTATCSLNITAAAAINCGAITLNGGTFDTGTNAAAITSINRVSGNPNLVIGSGGCTFAGVLTLAGTGALTINGVCTGISTLTTPTGTNAINANTSCSGIFTASGNTTIATGVVFTCQTSFTVGNAKTLTLADGASLVGMTAASGGSSTGAIVVGAGCTISTNIASSMGITLTAGVSITINGTAGNRSTLTNAGGPGAEFALSGGIQTLNYCDILKASSAVSSGGIVSGTGLVLRAVGLNIEGTGTKTGVGIQLYGRDNGASIVLRDSYLSNLSVGISGNVAGSGVIQLENLDFTKNVTGTSQVNATDITLSGSTYVEAKGVVLGGTTATISGTMGTFIADDYGHIAGDANPMGIGFIYDGFAGTLQRSTAAAKAGSYGARFTLFTVASGSKIHLLMPLEMECRVPILTGESIAVDGYARLSNGATIPTSALAVWIDPEKSWFATAQSVTPTLVADGSTWVRTQVNASTALGTTQKGSCRVVWRVSAAGAAGDLIDVGDVTVTITHADTTTTLYTFSMQNWAAGSPVADKPDFPAVAEVYPGTTGASYNAGNKVGTLRASNIHTGAGAPGIDLAAADLESGVMVDDVVGELVAGGGGGSTGVFKRAFG